jgi:hypothetical protein
MKYSNSKDKVSKISKYALNYAKMSGLFPDFDKKEAKQNKKTGGAKK